MSSQINRIVYYVINYILLNDPVNKDTKYLLRLTSYMLYVI